MSELHTHYEVKNGKLVPKKENQTTKKENQDKPASSTPSNSSGYGDTK